MSRLHPFDFVFGDFADTRFSEIQEDEQTGGAIDLARFSQLPSVTKLLEELGAYETTEKSPEALAQYVILLYATYRYWQGGKRTFVIDRARLEAQFENPGPTPTNHPNSAFYLVFPEQWFWAQTSPEAPHEPLDGMFVSHVEGRYTIVAVLGLRPERYGFSQVSAYATSEEMTEAVDHIQEPQFEPVMEGGDVAGFRSLCSEAELLHLSRLAMGSATQ